MSEDERVACGRGEGRVALGTTSPDASIPSIHLEGGVRSPRCTI